jgi:hypothetical protein
MLLVGVEPTELKKSSQLYQARIYAKILIV